MKENNLKTRDSVLLIGKNRHILKNQLFNDLGCAAFQLVLGHQLIFFQVPGFLDTSTGLRSLDPLTLCSKYFNDFDLAQTWTAAFSF